MSIFAMNKKLIFFLVLFALLIIFNFRTVKEGVNYNEDENEAEAVPEIIKQDLFLHHFETAQLVAEETEATSSLSYISQNKIIPSEERVVADYAPILMFHYIRDYNNSNDALGIRLSVSPEKFNNDLLWLKNNGYESVDLAYLQNPKKISGKPVIITFDDGYEDAYTAAFPLLKKYGFKGVFYLIYDKINFPGYLDWLEITEMRKQGMIFGSHTLSHPNLAVLAQTDLDKEIGDAKWKLEKMLGAPVDDFCYPSGSYNRMAVDVVKKYGYKTAVTTHSGLAGKNSSIYELERLRVTNGMRLDKLLVAGGN